MNLLLRIYHNPSCSKSRQALRTIVDSGLSHTVVKYLDGGVTKEELTSLLLRLRGDPADAIRWNEEVAPEPMSELKVEEVVALILDVPKLLQRPIIDDGTIAKVCRPPEIAEEFL